MRFLENFAKSTNSGIASTLYVWEVNVFRRGSQRIQYGKDKLIQNTEYSFLMSDGR